MTVLVDGRETVGGLLPNRDNIGLRERPLW